METKEKKRETELHHSYCVQVVKVQSPNLPVLELRVYTRHMYTNFPLKTTSSLFKPTLGSDVHWLCSSVSCEWCSQTTALAPLLSPSESDYRTGGPTPARAGMASALWTKWYAGQLGATPCGKEIIEEKKEQWRMKGKESWGVDSRERIRQRMENKG